MSNEVSDISLLLLISGIVLSIGIFFFFIYKYNRDRLNSLDLFDIAFIVSISGIVVGRGLGMINSWKDYLGVGISLLPVKDVAGEIKFVHAFPWEVFKINDGNFMVWGFSIGILLSILLIYLMFINIHRDIRFINNMVIAFLPAQLILILSQLVSFTAYGKKIGIINSYIPNISTSRVNLAIIELFLFAIIGIVIVIAKYKHFDKWGIYTMYFLYEMIVGLFIVPHTFYSNKIILGYHTSVLVSFVILVIFSFGLVKEVYIYYRGKNQNHRAKSSNVSIVVQQNLSESSASNKNLITKFKNIFK